MRKKCTCSKKKNVAKKKITKVMREFDEGKLHSGSKSGPIVTNRKQGIAIALSEARKASKKSSKNRVDAKKRVKKGKK